MAIGYGAKIVTDGLVLCLDAANPKSYPGGGTEWKDLSGNDNDGSLVNGVGFDSDNRGSLVFDGVNEYVSNIGNLTQNDFPNGVFTLIAQFKWGGNGGGSDGRNYILQNTGSGNYPLSLEINSRDFNPARFATWEHTTSGGVHRNSSKIVETNRWYNFAVVRTNEKILMHVDKEEIYSATRQSGNLLSFQGFNVGTHRSANNRWFDGNISNVQIYNRALSAEEIQQNYQALRGRYGI